MHKLAVLLFGAASGDEPQSYEEVERERPYNTWERVLIYLCLIGMAIKLYFLSSV